MAYERSNDILAGMEILSRSLRGVGEIGRAQVETAKLGLEEAQIGMALRKEQREEERFALDKPRIKAEADVATAKAKEAQKQQEELDSPWDVGTWVAQGKEQGLGTTVEQDVFQVEALPKIAKVFGANVVLKGDEGTGLTGFYDESKGRWISVRERNQKQQQVSSMIAVLTDPEKLWQAEAEKGNPEAQQHLEMLKKDPAAYYRKVAEGKQQQILLAQRGGIEKEALEIMKVDWQYSVEKAKLYTKTPDEIETHKAAMRAADDLHQYHARIEREAPEAAKVRGLQIEKLGQEVAAGRIPKADQIRVETLMMEERNTLAEIRRFKQDNPDWDRRVTNPKPGQSGWSNPQAYEQMARLTNSLRDIKQGQEKILSQYPSASQQTTAGKATTPAAGTTPAAEIGVATTKEDQAAFSAKGAGITSGATLESGSQKTITDSMRGITKKDEEAGRKLAVKHGGTVADTFLLNSAVGEEQLLPNLLTAMNLREQEAGAFAWRAATRKIRGTTQRPAGPPPAMVNVEDYWGEKFGKDGKVDIAKQMLAAFNPNLDIVGNAKLFESRFKLPPDDASKYAASIRAALDTKRKALLSGGAQEAEIGGQ